MLGSVWSPGRCCSVNVTCRKEKTVCNKLWGKIIGRNSNEINGLLTITSMIKFCFCSLLVESIF